MLPFKKETSRLPWLNRSAMHCHKSSGAFNISSLPSGIDGSIKKGAPGTIEAARLFISLWDGAPAVTNKLWFPGTSGHAAPSTLLYLTTVVFTCAKSPKTNMETDLTDGCRRSDVKLKAWCFVYLNAKKKTQHTQQVWYEWWPSAVATHTQQLQTRELASTIKGKGWQWKHNKYKLFWHFVITNYISLKKFAAYLQT